MLDDTGCAALCVGDTGCTALQIGCWMQAKIIFMYAHPFLQLSLLPMMQYHSSQFASYFFQHDVDVQKLPGLDFAENDVSHVDVLLD